jgi:hypothetical protein
MGYRNVFVVVVVVVVVVAVADHPTRLIVLRMVWMLTKKSSAASKKYKDRNCTTVRREKTKACTIQNIVPENVKNENRIVQIEVHRKDWP